MAILIRNPSIESCALPAPFRGVLKPGGSVVLNMTYAQALTAFGSEKAFGGLKVNIVDDGGPYDDEFQGSAGTAAIEDDGLVITGASDLQGAVTMGDTADITGAATAASFTATAAVQGATVVATGDITAAGGFRQHIGPFTAPGAAGVTAADQTELDMRIAHTVTALASSFVATRPGSIVGLSAQLSAGITTAGAEMTLDVLVTVNGVELVGGPEVIYDSTTALLSGFATAAKDAHAFVAGDYIGVSYTSTTIDNTPTLTAHVEIEQ